MIDRMFINGYEAKYENERHLKSYVLYLEKNKKSERTITSYFRDVTSLLKFLETRNLRLVDLDEEDFEEFFFYLQENCYAKEHIRRIMACINTFYKFLLEYGWIEENPMQYVRKNRHLDYRMDKTYLTLYQVDKFRKSVKRKQTSKQFETYVFLSISTGIKFTCIPTLKWSQVDFENRRIVDIVERPDKIITVYFSQYVKELLLELREEIKEGCSEYEYIFRSRFVTHNLTEYKPITLQQIRWFAVNLGKRVGIEDFTPHGLRRTCGMLLREGGMSEADISYILNHKTDDTSKIYEQVDVKKIIKQKDEIGI